MTTVAALSFVVATVSGCYWANTDSLRGVEQRVEEVDSPLIDQVYYTEVDILEPQELGVVVVPGAGAAEAATVWCDILLPLGADHDTLVMSDPDGEKTWPRPTTCL